MPKGVYVRTEETKEKLRLALLGNKYGEGNKGRIFTEEWKEKLREARKGIVFSDEHKRKLSKAGKGKTLSEETKLKMSESATGRIVSEETKEKIGLGNTGKKRSKEIKLKYRLSHLGILTGEKHPNWQGGITPAYQKIRTSDEYKNWRIEVYKKDYYTCQICGKKKGIKLNAHHIKLFSEYPELRFEVSNGITYCKDCHETNGFHKGINKLKVLVA